MKIRILLSACLLSWLFASAQPATDFTATDCSGNTFNLFTELNSGKVIVICWVMPCGACTGPALTTLNVVNSYISSHPHTVYMYLVDDYANTTCTSLDTWKDNNGLTAANSFSDPAINMADYGASGMPKIVVIGGNTHTVFYIANDVVDANDLQDAIDDALSSDGINDQHRLTSSLTVSPNPASGQALVTFDLLENTNIRVQLFDLSGKLIKQVFAGNLSSGKNQVEVDTQTLAAGTYLLKVSNGSRSNFSNLVVAR